MKFDTIAAIATGNTNQAISIIRVSGPRAFNVVKQVCHVHLHKAPNTHVALVKNQKTVVDKVVLHTYRAPRSYTGEDVVEINTHGGVVVTHQVLTLLLKHGARLAKPGEFSMRAFLNRKITLLQAEGINQLVHAQTVHQSMVAAQAITAKDTNVIRALLDNITNIIGVIETNIDYPEYDDIPTLTTKTLLPKLTKTLVQLDNTVRCVVDTQQRFYGVKVVIAGPPNAGKSSLLNTLLGEQKAIVTATPGTTRDAVEGTAEIAGRLYHFLDTAGIGTTSDPLAQVVAQKTTVHLRKADLLIWLVAPGQSTPAPVKTLSGVPHVVVHSKSDLKSCKHPLHVSSKKHDVAQLTTYLTKRFARQAGSQEQTLLVSDWQRSLLLRAQKSLQEAVSGLNEGYTPDVVVVDVREAWKNVASVLGKVFEEELITQIFARFCLGK